MGGGFGVELLGWTTDSLGLVQHRRGWTETAIEQLELGWDPMRDRVVIPVRDPTGSEVGELRYDPTGTRRPKMHAAAGTPRELFPPPESIADHELRGRTLWLVEGEPDAIRLWSLGIPAVAVPGAQNWRDEWAARFTGRRWTIAVCFDCDQAGRAGAVNAATALVAAGADARLVELDADRDDGYDLSDFTAAAATADERDQAAGLLEQILQRTDPYLPEVIGEHGRQPWRSVTWSTFRDTSPPDRSWLIRGLLPAGALCFIAGPPKRGKTWIGITLALSLALGRPYAGEYDVPQVRDVLYVALEGSATGFRTRIGALARGLDADPDSDQLDRLHMLYRPRPFDLAEIAGAAWLVQEAIDVDAALVLVDVLRAAARFDENAAADFGRIRDHLDPLLAAGRTVALLHHFGKLSDTQQQRSPGERMAGTGAMYGALDVGLLITKSDNHARTMRVDVEARDFAAPDALGLIILGDGTGTHGGLTYADTATLAISAEAAGHEDIVGNAAAWFEEHGEWLGGDDLGEELGVTRRTIEQAAKDDTKRRAADGLEPRLVRWDRDGRDLPPKPDGSRWHPSARPWGTPTMLTDFSVRADRDGPRSLLELGPDFSVPSKEGDRGTEKSGQLASEATEP